MTKIRTNFIEIVLKEIMIGKKIYLDDKVITIDNIDYQPITQEVFIKSGVDGYKMEINSNYDFELDLNGNGRIIPTKGKIKGKNKT